LSFFTLFDYMCVQNMSSIILIQTINIFVESLNNSYNYVCVFSKHKFTLKQQLDVILKNLKTHAGFIELNSVNLL